MPPASEPLAARQPRTPHQEAFSHYLRTGERLTTAEWLARHEVKFNPWHDRIGRFTFGPGGGGSPASGGRGRAAQAAPPALRPAAATPRSAPEPKAEGTGFRSDFVRGAVAPQTSAADTYFELNKRQAGLDRLRTQAGPHPAPAVAADLADFQARLDANRVLLDKRYRFADAQVSEILRAGLTPYDVAAGASRISAGQGDLRDYLSVAQVVPVGVVASGVGKVLRGAERVVAAAEPEVAQIGGTYRWVRKNQEKGYEAHHLVPDSVTSVPRGEGLAISMPRAHHRDTKSWGRKPEAKAYRAEIAKVLQMDGYRAAMNHEIAAIRETFGKAFDDAIRQALEQADKLGIKSWILRYISSKASTISSSG